VQDTLNYIGPEPGRLYSVLVVIVTLTLLSTALQPLPLHRQKDKVVALPDLPEELVERQESFPSTSQAEGVPGIFEVYPCSEL
jgi:hypothetical protein